MLEIILITLLLICFALLPSLLVWAAFNYFLSEWYSLPPVRMTVLSFMLTVLTGTALNLELESGILSLPFQVLILNLCWTLLLVPLTIAIKYHGFINSKNI